MIASFRDKRTAAIFRGLAPKAVAPDIIKRAQEKLELLDAAADVKFLRFPPGNRLEALLGDRAGQFSIRVNNQWRICFVWRDGNAHNVELCDYH